ncbi:uncharacterized protein [Salminus brasiliensis]|uniref:uncharacterized protein isoform X2 n=1 Tax=Salminus brasiliensis TaxID=930266 RepID=UPI003B837338
MLLAAFLPAPAFRWRMEEHEEHYGNLTARLTFTESLRRRSRRERERETQRKRGEKRERERERERSFVFSVSFAVSPPLWSWTSPERAAEDEGEQEHLKKHLSTFDITDLLTSFRSSPTPWSSELEELRSHWAALRLLDGAAATELVDVENWHKKHSQAMNQHSWRRKKVMETLHTKSHGLAFPQCIPLLWTQEGCAHCLESRSA